MQEGTHARRDAVEAFEQARHNELNALARRVVTSARYAPILLKGFGRDVQLKMARAGKKSRKDAAPEEENLDKMPRHEMPHRRRHLSCEVRFVRADELQVKVGVMCNVLNELIKRISVVKDAQDGEVMIQRAQIARGVKGQRRGLRAALSIREGVEFGRGGLKVGHFLLITLSGEGRHSGCIFIRLAAFSWRALKPEIVWSDFVKVSCVSGEKRFI